MINSNNNNNVWGMYIIIGYYYTVVYVYMIFDIKGIHVYVPYTEGAFFFFLAAAISGRRSGPPNYYPVSNLSP